MSSGLVGAGPVPWVGGARADRGGLKGRRAYPGPGESWRRQPATARAHARVAARAREPAGIPDWRSVGPATSLSPPEAHRARLPTLLASPPPDGRTWRGGRSRGWAQRAGSDSARRWPRAGPRPRPPGHPGAAAAAPCCRRRPPLERAPPLPPSPRAQSPRRCLLCCACAQSSRGPGHAPGLGPMSGAPSV